MNDLARMDECKAVRNIVHDVENHGEFEVRGYMYFSGSGHLQIDGDHGRSLSIDIVCKVKITELHIDIIQRHVRKLSVPQ